jgi:hypothetical protein
MRRAMRKWTIGCLALTAAACSVTGGAQLNSQPTGKSDSQVRDVNPDDLTKGGHSSSLENMRFRSDVCQGVELRPDYAPLTAAHFLGQLKAASLEYSVEKAREDLIYVDVKTPGGTSRFRVATLPSAPEAGRHLHEAVLQHGPGSWGVHRSNLAVLGPIGQVEQVIDFAATTKLCCWGVLTVAGRDDAFVVPGGYLEF